ncbi:MAG: DUF721 domain-containing protein [Muribaculaceae bacterium]
MKRTSAETVGDIINRVLKAENLDGKLDEHRLVSLWPEVVGPVINKYTSQRYINNHMLYVHLTSAPLRNELLLHRSHLVKALNEAIGHDVITDIVFR